MGRAGCVRCKDAGSLDSSAIGATEDAAACVHSAFQRPVLVQLEVLLTLAPALGARHVVREFADRDHEDEDASGREHREDDLLAFHIGRLGCSEQM